MLSSNGKYEASVTAPMKISQTRQRPKLTKAHEEEEEINFISSRKQKSEARKKDSVKATNRSITLFNRIKEKKWDAVLEHFDYYERDATNWIEEVNDDGSKRWRSLPIHLVCEHKPTFEVVRQLLRIYPDSLNEKNYGGDLPIHIACREGASKDIIHIMLEKNSETIKIPDCEGRMPLHLAACSETIHVNSIQDLISYNEKATRTPDDFGLLPLHWACTKNAPAINVETIIKAYPFAIEQKDVYEYLPIDRIRTSKNTQKAKIVELLSRDVASWSSAMMSTIMDLSSKVAAAGKMQQDFKAKEGECKVMQQQSKRSYDEINALTNEIHKMQDIFVQKTRQMQRTHVLEIQQLEQRFEKDTFDLRNCKEVGERKGDDLKILVDELVEQLKIQKSLVDEKEMSRKELKTKAMALVSRLEESKKEVNETNAEIESLKLYEVKLKYEIKKRDQHIHNISGRKGRGADFEDGIDLDYRSRGPHETVYTEDRHDQFENDIPRTFECVRIEEENSY